MSGWWFLFLGLRFPRPQRRDLGNQYSAIEGERDLEPVTLTSIQAARARIGEAIHVSPCHLSHHLSELADLPIHLKLENLQRTGSFKERGALNKLLTLSESERKRVVIAASAGNHAQGVAFHAAAD